MHLRPRLHVRLQLPYEESAHVVESGGVVSIGSRRVWPFRDGSRLADVLTWRGRDRLRPGLGGSIIHSGSTIVADQYCMKVPHIPPTKILVPTDLSETSLRAWGLGKELARALKASIELLFVYEPPTPDPWIQLPPLADELKDTFRNSLRRRLGEDVAISIREGVASDAILEFAQERSIDLIVMATHGRSGPARVVLGSVAESLSLRSPIPVLTIRERWNPIRKILAPVNFTHYSLNGFFAAAALAEALGAKLDVLDVESGTVPLKTPQFNAAVAKLPQYFDDKPPVLLHREGHPAKEILAAGASYDLIALVSHRRSLLGDIVLGTTAERVIRHSPTPVFSIPNLSKELGERLLERAAGHAARQVGRSP